MNLRLNTATTPPLRRRTGRPPLECLTNRNSCRQTGLKEQELLIPLVRLPPALTKTTRPRTRPRSKEKIPPLVTFTPLVTNVRPGNGTPPLTQVPSRSIKTNLALASLTSPQPRSKKPGTSARLDLTYPANLPHDTTPTNLPRAKGSGINSRHPFYLYLAPTVPRSAILFATTGRPRLADEGMELIYGHAWPWRLRQLPP